MESVHCDQAEAANHELAVEDSWGQLTWFWSEEQRIGKFSETLIEQNSRYGYD
jgi:hypothetical protein